MYEYDAVGVVAQAIKDANSDKPSAIIDALHKVKDYQGLTGTITFNKAGDRTRAVYIVIEVKNDQFVPYVRLNDQGKWELMQQ